MSIAKNTIRFSDITTTPIKLKYSSSFASSSLASYGITQNKGVNVPAILSGSMLSPNIQNALKYKTIQQLYYKEYISSSLLGTGSAYDPSLQSTAASGSYDNDIRYFPTASGDQIRFFAIPTETFPIIFPRCLIIALLFPFQYCLRLQIYKIIIKKARCK